MDAKPLIIVIIFVLILAVIASGIIGNVDLTDSGTTQDMLAATSAGSTNLVNPDVFGSGSSSSSSLPSSASGGGQPVTGKSSSPYNSPCGSYYIVQSGDTLTRIARTCLISIEDLLVVNPSITNQHLISVGQRITIYNTLPVITVVPTATQISTIVPGAGTIATLPPGLRPGDRVTVTAQGFSPGAQVRVGMIKVGENPNPTSMPATKTDPNGALKFPISVPMRAKVGEQWTVAIVIMTNPPTQVTAVPFTIGR